jgi:hypothetical protein
MPGKKKKTVLDDRVTIKIDRTLWKVITEQIERHPEWGMSSASDFIRRSVDRELEYRTMTVGQKMVEIQLNPGRPREGSRDKGP